MNSIPQLPPDSYIIRLCCADEQIAITAIYLDNHAWTGL